MRKLKLYRVSANSMAESVIAMAIIAVCLTVGGVTFTTATSQSGGLALLNGRAALHKWVLETQNTKDYTHATIKENGYRIERVISRNGIAQKMTFTLTCGSTKEQKTFFVYEE